MSMARDYEKVALHSEEQLLDIAKDDDKIRHIDLHLANEISYENSHFNEHYTLKNLFFQRIKKFVKLFSSFCLIGTVLIISHG